MIDQELFKFKSEVDFREILVKTSISLVFDRYASNRPILFALLNRLVIYLQNPVAIIIHDKSKKNPQVVFKSLNSKKGHEKNKFPEFGDPEVANHFDTYLDKESIDKLLETNSICIYGTEYWINFFQIEYPPSGDIKESIRFSPLSNCQNEWNGIANILEYKDIKNSELNIVLPIADVMSTTELQNRLSKEFRSFLHKVNSEKHEGSIDIKADVTGYILQVRKKVVDDVYSRIATSPLFNTPVNFPNFFLFLKTATNPARFNGKFPYGLQLVLGEKQETSIKDHYDKLKGKPELCKWFKEGICMIGHDNEIAMVNGRFIGKCILTVIPDFNIVKVAQTPLVGNERSFIDTALSSGMLSFTSMYPAFLRDRAENDTGIPTQRQLALWCLTHQVFYKEKIFESKFDKNSENGNKKITVFLEPRAVVSPIHVSGITSMAVLFMSPMAKQSDDEEIQGYVDRINRNRWVSIYSFFLSAISRTVLRQARAELKTLYLDALLDEVRTKVVNAVEKYNERYVIDYAFIDKLNKKCSELAMVYPFPVISFSDRENEYFKKIVKIGNKESVDVYYNFNASNNFAFTRLFRLAKEYVSSDDIKACFDRCAEKILFDWINKYGDKEK